MGTKADCEELDSRLSLVTNQLKHLHENLLKVFSNMVGIFSAPKDYEVNFVLGNENMVCLQVIIEGIYII